MLGIVYFDIIESWTDIAIERQRGLDNEIRPGCHIRFIFNECTTMTAFELA